MIELACVLVYRADMRKDDYDDHDGFFGLGRLLGLSRDSHVIFLFSSSSSFYSCNITSLNEH